MSFFLKSFATSLLISLNSISVAYGLSVNHQFLDKSKAEVNSEAIQKINKQYRTISSQLELLTGVWEGTYICGQGLTGLRLVIEARSTTQIEALFFFFPHPRNPSVPSGVFRMSGTYRIFNSSDFSNLLELEATDWIDRPSGYSTVDLVGNLFPAERRIVGEVASPRCSNFDVEKVAEEVFEELM